MNEVFARRFTELAAQLPSLPRASGHTGVYYTSGGWQKWATSAENLIKAIYGEGSSHHKRFEEAYGKCVGQEYQV